MSVRRPLTCWPPGARRARSNAELFGRLAVLARRADGPVPSWFEDWLEAEREAASLRIWSPMLVPGLLQTADYARALFLAAQADTSDDAINALVEARLERQTIFQRLSPPHAVVVLDEAVLHRLIGSREIMLDQMGQLLVMSGLPYISLQVVPSDNGANAGLSGAFDIASVDDMPGTLRMEGIEDQTTDKRSLVRKAAVTFDRVRADALPRSASRDLINRLAEELWKA